jgi:hypothetical protein
MAQNGPNNKFDRVIEALLSTATVTEAAKKAGIGRRTITRWIADDPDFRERLQQARRDLLQHGSGRLCALMGEAVTVVAKGLAGETITKSAYLCAKLTIEACRTIAEDELLSRVEALEQDVRDRQIGRVRELENLSLEQLQERLRQLRQMAREDETVE